MEDFVFSPRNFKRSVLELDVCKNCIQGYGGRGAWCQCFGLTVLLCLQKLFSPFMTKNYF